MMHTRALNDKQEERRMHLPFVFGLEQLEVRAVDAQHARGKLRLATRPGRRVLVVRRCVVVVVVVVG